MIGVEARTAAPVVSIRARGGVIFGSGGFTANAEMCLDYLRGPIFGGCTVATGEGDFVHIGGAVGAKLGNMNHAWRWPVILEQALRPGARRVAMGCLEWRQHDPGEPLRPPRRQREDPYNERTQAHFDWDPYTATYPNLILFMIYDQRTRERFGDTSGVILRPGLNAPFIRSGHTFEELDDVDRSTARRDWQTDR